MFLFAGPNGAGKSTLYKLRIQPFTAAPFINADLIQRDELKDAAMAASYRAAAVAEERRQLALIQRTSFVSESTFSHPSKLKLVEQAKAAGFRVVMFHVGLRSANLSVSRVAVRHMSGGHDVPEDKIRERFERNKSLIRQAVLLADVAFVYDNSQMGCLPNKVLTFRQSQLVSVGHDVPAWVQELYATELATLA